MFGKLSEFLKKIIINTWFENSEFSNRKFIGFWIGLISSFATGFSFIWVVTHAPIVNEVLYAILTFWSIVIGAYFSKNKLATIKGKFEPNNGEEKK